MTQDEALRIMKTGANVFLTGEPGSGKTHTINRYVRYLHSCGIEPAITASTGIAATHIGGMTIHSWSGIGIKQQLSEYDLDALLQNERFVRRIRRAHVLIVDEVSMLSASVLSMVDQVCRAMRHSSDSFGGLQVILVGDFFQLPPVVRRNEIESSISFDFETIEDKQEAHFAYQSSVWNDARIVICYLSEQHRQEDGAFLDVLSAIRSAKVTKEHRALLKKRQVSSTGNFSNKITTLFPHNANVDRINERELAKLSGEARVFEMYGTGSQAVVAGLIRSCLSPERLLLKIGAKVLFTKNNIERGFVNGTMGEVVGFEGADFTPVVKTVHGSLIEALPMEWAVETEGRVLGKIVQVPLRLAWAITVHKSQGMSLDAAVMDLSSSFEYGQGYVALSRVRTLEGLYLLGMNERALEVHPDTLERDVRFREESEVAYETFGKITEKEIKKMHEDFVVACGGEVKPEYEEKKVEGEFEGRRIKNRGFKKEKTVDKTGALVKEKKTIAEMAALRNVTEQTIVSHIEELLESKKIQPGDVEYLKKGIEFDILDIQKAFTTVGSGTLRPVYDFFEGAYPFITIRIARFFYKPN